MILMNDFRAEPEELRRAEIEAAERVLRSGWFILGKELQSFENEWARYCGTQFAVGVASGMDAIEIGLRALNIGNGDEVITTPMTAAATAMAILRTGASPVLADIDPETGLLSRSSVELCLTKKTKAVVLVHLYGQMRDVDAWQAFCAVKNIALLEDCAQAHGACWNGKKAGTFGACGAYSFYPTKNLGARGDGGALVTNSMEIKNVAQHLRNYGQEKRYVHTAVGLNSRLDEIQAAILAVRLQWLHRFNRRRQQIAAKYLECISNRQIRFLAPPVQSASHVFHLFVVCSAMRDVLADYLRSRGIETLIHYPLALHQQRFSAGTIRTRVSLKAAEEHAARCLSLPCHPQMTDEDVQKVIDCLNAF